MEPIIKNKIQSNYGVVDKTSILQFGDTKGLFSSFFLISKSTSRLYIATGNGSFQNLRRTKLKKRRKIWK